MSIQDLILNGKLDIFNNRLWKDFWRVCKAQTVSIQDRLRTQGFVHFAKFHAHNLNASTLILKRDLTLNDIFYLFYYLMANINLKNLHLSFVETGVENNSNYLTPFNVAPTTKKHQPQILVPADRMEVTTVMFQPLSVLANNVSLQSLTLSGYLQKEISDYLINGLALNTGITQLTLQNFNLNRSSVKSWTLCFAVNTVITTINGISLFLSFK